MKSVDETELRTIANALKVDYQALPTPFNRRSLGTRMSRDFQVPKGKLYDLIADVGAHHRFFPHLKALNVIDSAMLADAIGDNQVVVVEGLAEGGSKLGVKLFTLKPPDRIEGELMTDPFVSAAGVTAHKRDGPPWRDYGRSEDVCAFLEIAALIRVKDIDMTAIFDGHSACSNLCGGCAFRPGTEANDYSPTQLKTHLCLLLQEPFFCHERTDGTGNPLLCRGFLSALAAQNQASLPKMDPSSASWSAAAALMSALTGGSPAKKS